jgi:hypothetical protein
MDNRYYKYNCPPLMNDGRFLTSHVRSRVFDQYVRNVNNINSAQDYKNFLQLNGDSILNNLKAYHRESNTCKVEGRCLPMSGSSSDDMSSYLNKNNEVKSAWYEQVNENTNVPLNQTTNVLNESTGPLNNYDILNANKANELARNIYNQMLVQQEQNFLQSKTNNQENEKCTFCAVKN